MISPSPKLVNVHYVPNYNGFVPRVVSENMFGKCFTKLANSGIRKFDEIRYSGGDSDNFKEWQYNPLSKTIGSFRNKTQNHYEKSLKSHDFTPRIRDSGYSNNHLICDKKGWTPEKTLHSDQKRTEYRIQFNNVKSVHYKGPIISTGKLKKKEKVYKHT